MGEARVATPSAVFSQDWYLVPAEFDCGHCGAQSRCYGVVLGAKSQLLDGVLDGKGAGAGQGVYRLEHYGCVRRWKTVDWHGCDFVAQRSEDLLQLRGGEMEMVCEHCGEGSKPECATAAAMENFVQWGALRAMRNERQLIVSDSAEISHFHDGTVIEVCETIGPSYAVVARGACADGKGRDGTVEFLLDLAGGNYAWSARFVGGDGRKDWSALSAVGGREVGVMVEQLAQAGIVVGSLNCTDDAGPVCVFAYEKIVEGLLNHGYSWSERAA